jgi:hypothetical protein
LQVGTLFDLFAGNLMRERLPASSWQHRFAFVPEGLHLDLHCSTNNPASVSASEGTSIIGGFMGI